MHRDMQIWQMRKKLFTKQVRVEPARKYKALRHFLYMVDLYLGDLTLLTIYSILSFVQSTRYIRRTQADKKRRWINKKQKNGPDGRPVVM